MIKIVYEGRLKCEKIGEESFSDDGFALVQEENRLEIINLQGKHVIPPTIEEILLDGYVVDANY